jgi:hypothetical protein
VGLSPPFFILAETQNSRSKEREEKTDGPRTDDITISASTNKMKLGSAILHPCNKIAASEQKNRRLLQCPRMLHITADAVTSR